MGTLSRQVMVGGCWLASLLPSLLLPGLANATTPSSSARSALKGDICYQIVTDRFYDGNATNNNPAVSAGLYDSTRSNWKLYWGGDWAGIQAKIPYLQSLGVTAIWISPPVDNINQAAVYSGVPNAGYHGYWARDFKKTEEHFGTWTEFQNLIAAAHIAGIKVIIDWAPNHTSPVDASNPAFAENGALYDNGTYVARYGSDPSGYFHHNGVITNWDDRYETKYKNLADLADFEQANSLVNGYLRSAIDAWLPYIDGIRVDAVKHMTFGWQRAYADHILHLRDVALFGEWFMSNASDPLYRDAARYANESGISELDFPMNMAIRQVFGSGSSMWTLENAIVKTGADYKYKENLVTFIDNHDMPRFLSLNNNPTQLHLALTFLLTLRGTPCVYYGTEQYLNNATDGGGDPYNRPMMTAFGSGTTAFTLINRLATLRRNQPAVQFGSHQQRWINNDVYVYERKFFNDVVLVAINKSGSNSHSITGLYSALPAGAYADQLSGLLGGGSITVVSGGGNNPVAPFWLGPGQAAVWSYRQAASPSQPEIGSVTPVQTRVGNVLTIDGRGFGATQSSSKVYLSAVEAAVASWSDERVTVTVPAGVSSGITPVKIYRGAYSNGYDVMMLAGEQVPVTFTVNNALTSWGDQVYLTGSVYELSNWSTATVPGSNNPVLGGAMGPAETSSSLYPSWLTTTSVPCGRSMEFKFVKINASGGVTWEGGGNHGFTSPACGTTATGSVSVNWQN